MKEQKTGGCVGIDISKAHLDLAVRYGDTNQALKRGENSVSGVKAVVGELRKLKPSLVVIEPTGGYERELAYAMGKAGIPFAMVNPKRARYFAKAGGYAAKTDKVDAAMLAHFGVTIKPAVCIVLTEKGRQLADLRKRRQQLVEMIVAEKNRSKLATGSSLKSIKATLEFLESQQAKIDSQMHQLVIGDAEWTRKERLLNDTPGIGQITAFALLAALPEIGTLNRKEIAALVGIAPINRDSGKLKGTRHITGGRADVRTALYMATLAAIRHNPIIHQTFKALRANGKHKMVALVACMRKFLVILNAILKSNLPFEDRSKKYPSTP